LTVLFQKKYRKVDVFGTQWDSAYLRHGTSYQYRDTDPDPYPNPCSRSPPKFNHLFTGPLPTFPENFVQIRSVVFAQSC